jgi:peptidoglycan/LPS O-acetylase OafA/YrhL
MRNDRADVAWASGNGRIDALDGLRAIAIVAVVVYHADVSWSPGGFLGVSLFFTLSGFLITRLLLDEHAHRGRVALGCFYARRFRRLAPAAVVVLVTTSLVLVIDGLWSSALQRDLVAGLTYSSNWQQVTGGQGYGSMFGMPSPFMHFWSLAIEEQFYLVIPAVAVLTLRRSRRLFATVLAAGLAAAWFAGRVGPVATRYFRTDVRALELLAGCLLAVVSTRAGRGTLLDRLPGLPLLAIFVALCTTVSVTDTGLYTFVLPVVAAVSCMLVVTACRPSTRLARVLSWPPLVVIGRLSYAIYLVHWPVDVLVGDALNRLLLTAALAAALHYLVERPTRRLRPAFSIGPVAIVSSLVLVGCTLPNGRSGPAVSSTLPPLPAASRVAPASGPAVTTTTTAMPASSSSPSIPPAAEVAGTSSTTATYRPRVLVVGDSTGEFMGDALGARPEIDVTNAARRGCPLLDVNDIPVQLRRSTEFKPWPAQTGEKHDCNWAHYMPDVPAGFDFAVIVAGPTMTPTYRLAPGQEVHVGDPAADAWLGASLTRLVAELQRHAARVIWLTAPASEATYGVGTTDDWYWTSRERTDAWNTDQRAVAAQTGGTVIEFARWFYEQPDHDSYRPDGSHLEGQGADLAAAYVTMQLQTHAH